MILELKDSVVTLETAKRLRELGVRQDSQFFHINRLDTDYIYNDEWFVVSFSKKNEIKEEFESSSDNVKYYAAPNSDEMGRLLPEQYHTKKCNSIYNINWYCFLAENSCHLQLDLMGMESEAEARGLLLIYLLEQKLVTADEINKNGGKV